jgi:hypothetical protein
MGVKAENQRKTREKSMVGSRKPSVLVGFLCQKKDCAVCIQMGLQFYTFFGISIGIKWRMIAIGKKITFYFLQNI